MKRRHETLGFALVGLVIGSSAFLTACGADDEPQSPSSSATTSGSGSGGSGGASGPGGTPGAGNGGGAVGSGGGAVGSGGSPDSSSGSGATTSGSGGLGGSATSSGSGGLGSTDCMVSNRTQWSLGGDDCKAGTTLTKVNEPFVCNQALASYGTLPLKVVIQSTAAWDSAGAVLLDGGCTGDGDDDTIDLIVEIEGGGPSTNVGPGADALKTRTSPGPHDIQLTGTINCGRRAQDAHQDGVQIQGGSNIAFVNIRMGDYQNGLSTCQGAGGAFFYSINNPQNIDVLGGEFIACNHGLLGDEGSGHDVIDAKFRSGRNDGTDPNCDFASGGACTQTGGLNMSNVTCEEWNPGTDTWQ